MTNFKYTLDDKGNPVVEIDLLKWAHWYETANLGVARESVGNAVVSTVFLSLDHAHDDGPPVLWESRVFGGKLNHHCERCAGSREQAEAMHAAVVDKVKQNEPPR